MNLLKNCKLCPRNCNVDRLNNKIGFCKATDKLKIARAALHFWEEPCISGEKGSGTVFFSNCTLKCVFCQNNDISQCDVGKEISIERLSNIFLELQDKGALNINLVTPTHYVPQIIEALKIAKNQGLNLPIIYNSSGYENIETLKLLDGYIDIYLPDLKYYNNKYSIKYSNARNYFDLAIKAIEEMVKQVGKAKFNENGIIEKGVIVRHLLLPGLLFDSKKVLDALYNKFGNKIYISIMNQYTPLKHVENYPEINKKISKKYYDAIIDYAISIGIENGFIQEDGTAKESFIPTFNYEGI